LPCLLETFRSDPTFVKGAEKGDVLTVEIKETKPLW